jgi:hypothetical protein
MVIRHSSSPAAAAPGPALLIHFHGEHDESPRIFVAGATIEAG